MRITLMTGVAVLAAATLFAAPAAGQLQLPRLALRGGMAVPKGDYDQTSEGRDMFARIGWTAGAEVRWFLTPNLGLFASYDRISNPVDEGEVEASLGTTNHLSSDPHVAHMTMGGLRMEGQLVPNATLALHGGVGLAVFKPGDYSIENEGEIAFESDRRTSLAGGLSVTIYNVEAMFRFYPFGTFEHGGTITIDDDESDAPLMRAPVRVMTLTIGYVI